VPRATTIAVVAALVCAPAAALAQQDLGHKFPGTVGLRGGSPPSEGILVGYLFFYYSASSLRDRNGGEVPINLNLKVFANAVGATGAFDLPRLHTTFFGTISAPFTVLRVNSDNPEINIDTFGLGDIYFSPCGLGWRFWRLELRAGYGFYSPTGKFEPGGRDGIGRGQWTNQIDFGGTFYFDRARTWHLSVLSSFQLNGQKRRVDITRGASIQLQGGAGKTLYNLLDVGVIGYALWQVSDDSGSALPPVLIGIRQRGYAVGPEVGVRIPKIGARLSARYEVELGERAGVSGHVVVGQLVFKLY
jgi:hypothetical protein